MLGWSSGDWDEALATRRRRRRESSSVGSQSVQLVEAGGGTAGTAAATITVTKTDALTTASVDTAYLTSNGWSTADSGVTYTKAGTYGTATFTIASGVVAYALSNSTPATQALTANQAATFGSIPRATSGLSRLAWI